MKKCHDLPHCTFEFESYIGEVYNFSKDLRGADVYPKTQHLGSHVFKKGEWMEIHTFEIIVSPSRIWELVYWSKDHWFTSTAVCCKCIFMELLALLYLLRRRPVMCSFMLMYIMKTEVAKCSPLLSMFLMQFQCKILSLM